MDSLHTPGSGRGDTWDTAVLSLLQHRAHREYLHREINKIKINE